MAGSKWEFGVVSFFDSMDDYDQFTKIKTAYTSPTTQSSQTLVLDDTIATDYTASPFYLWPDLNAEGSTIPGSIFYVGPSSDASFDGTMEVAVAQSVSTNTITLKAHQGWHTFAVLDANYSVGDPVVIRTLPHGWTPMSTPYSNTFGISPVSRSRETANPIRLASNSTAETLTSEDAYKYFNQHGVRLMVDDSTSNANRGIERTTPVNSITARIRRYRASWYYRVVGASTNTDSLLNPRAEVWMSARDGSGAALSAITGETGTVVGSILMRSYTTQVSDWTMDSHLISPYSSDSNTWTWNTGSDNFSDTMMNRINRIKIQAKLTSGTNAAFDIDDIMIEHCDGTSKEANGYYEMDDYPTQGSLSWTIRKGPTSNKNSLANNTMRASITHGNKKPKHVISAQYNGVTRQIYDDLMILEQWQSRGNLIALRTFNESLPNVMVGFLTLSNFNNEMPDLGRVSFGLQFEEA